MRQVNTSTDFYWFFCYTVTEMDSRSPTWLQRACKTFCTCDRWTSKSWSEQIRLHLISIWMMRRQMLHRQSELTLWIIPLSVSLHSNTHTNTSASTHTHRGSVHISSVSILKPGRTRPFRIILNTHTHKLDSRDSYFRARSCPIAAFSSADLKVNTRRG